MIVAMPSYLRSIVDQDGAIILDLRNDQFLSMNPVGNYIWSRLLNGEEPDQIAQALAEETGMDIAVVWADVQDFLADLKSKRLFHFPESTSEMGVRR